MSRDGNQEGNGWSRIKKKAQEYRDHFIEHVERRDKVYVALSGIAVAAFTFALFIATFALWFAGERHSERQLRAYIGQFQMSLSVYPFEQGGFVYISHVEIRNFGQTPAYDMRMWGDSVLDVPGALPFSDTPKSGIVSGGIGFPGAGLHVRRSGQLTAEEVDALRNRSKLVFFWGAVTYLDAFGHSRYFKFRLINTELQVGQAGLYGMGPHDIGQQAD